MYKLKSFYYCLFLALLSFPIKATHTLPSKFEDNRIFLTPTLSDGRTVTFYTDTGGGGNVISQELYDLYKWPTITRVAGNEEIVLSQMPEFMKNYSIPKSGLNNFLEEHLFIVPKSRISHSEGYDGFLGGRWHAEKVIEINYLKGSFSILKSISEVKLSGFTKVKLGFQKNDKNSYTTAFPRMAISVSGIEYQMLLDTGATSKLSNEARKQIPSNGKNIGTSYMASSIFDKWRIENPTWKVIEKADENLNEDMIEVPEIMIGGTNIGPVWFTRREDKNFHQYMSSMMDQKIDGAVGGSALQYFRVVVDYPNEFAYFSLKG